MLCVLIPNQSSLTQQSCKHDHEGIDISGNLQLGLALLVNLILTSPLYKHSSERIWQGSMTFSKWPLALHSWVHFTFFWTRNFWISDSFCTKTHLGYMDLYTDFTVFFMSVTQLTLPREQDSNWLKVISIGLSGPTPVRRSTYRDQYSGLLILVNLFMILHRP